jgi:vacuolar-type H+-ATPase subunit C/Vma6
VNRVSRYGFILAKMYGVMERSYVGKNFQDLFRLKKVTELYDLLYPGARSPETLPYDLPSELEGRIVESGIRAMTYVLDSLDKPPEILVHMLRKLEYQNVKTLLRGMQNGGSGDARLWNLGAYAALPADAGQNPENAIRESPYAWVLESSETPALQLENALDREYYTTLMRLARALPARDREGVQRLATLEATLANAIWALRLRFFFGMDLEKARGLLIPAGDDVAGGKAILSAFEIPADSVEDWRAWKLGFLLEDQYGESFRTPDPLRAQAKASQILYTRARSLFHQRPFTLGPLAAYFTLKEHEASLLKTAVEAMHLSIPMQGVLDMVGAR